MLTIKDPNTIRLARKLAQRTGKPVADADARAISDQLARLPAPEGAPTASPEQLVAELEAIADEIAVLPDLDARAPDELLGYDEHGAFKPW